MMLRVKSDCLLQKQITAVLSVYRLSDYLHNLVSLTILVWMHILYDTYVF